MTDDLALPGVAAVILAAGRGVRMKSDLPKVMHRIAGRAMIHRVLDAVGAVAPERTVVTIGPGMDELAEAVAPARTVVQPAALGTADAVKAARGALSGFGEGEGDRDALVAFGDAALIEGRTLRDLVAARRDAGAAVAVLGVDTRTRNRYGRLVVGLDGTLERIIEFADATDEEKQITLCNSGMMSIDARLLFELVDAIGNDNAKGEYYLTDLVSVARARGFGTAVLEIDDPDDAIGADSRADLARFEAIAQRRLRARAMEEGCGMPAPDTVHFSWDTAIGRDVTIEPYVVIGTGVAIGDGAVVRSFTHLEGCAIARGARVGPFARLRPGARIGEGARVGNFVEIKNAAMEPGAKANHLSYIGDARVGAGANVGAGAITCNYDGVLKHRTDIGAGAFIGSNAALVAPVRVGDGAIVGAGSTVTRDVEADALAVGRSRQIARPGAAPLLRQRKAARKARRDDGKN